MNRPPVDLDWYVEHLDGWLREKGMPSWQDVMITEQLVYDDRGLPRAVGKLNTVEEYRARFTDLATRGWGWINLQAVGLLGTTLLLSVEVPNYEPAGEYATTVNLSGPTGAVAEHGFDICRIIDTIDERETP
jgi:hypothetical protein